MKVLYIAHTSDNEGSTVALINIVLSVYIPLFGVFQGTGHSGVPAIVAITAEQ